MSASTWPPDRAALAAAGITPPTPAAEVQAAVLVPLFLAREVREPHVVLTRRRGDLRRHPGEISFPGGRRDDADESLERTALREAEEEIGLPSSRVAVIGELPPTSTFATNYLIHPFVGAIPEGVAWRVSPREVDAVLELPLAELRSNRTTTRLERRGITFETDAYVLDGNVIWGATARILENLLARVHGGGPDGDALELASA